MKTKNFRTVQLAMAALIFNLINVQYSHADYFTNTGSMNIQQAGYAFSLLPSGKVLISGGHNSAGVITNSAELYDAISGTWTTIGAMTTNRNVPAATLLQNGKVLVSGGLSV